MMGWRVPSVRTVMFVVAMVTLLEHSCESGATMRAAGDECSDGSALPVWNHLSCGWEETLDDMTRLTKLKLRAITQHRIFIPTIYSFIYEIFIYICTDWFSAVNTADFTSTSVRSFIPSASLFCFLLLWLFFLPPQQRFTFTCANAISMKKCFCTKRIKIF